MIDAKGRASVSLRLPRSFLVRLLPWLFSVILSFNLSACVVPVKAPRVQTPSSGTIKGKVDTTFLKEGMTPREEVREKLGPLAAGYEKPNLFVARWMDSEWMFLWGVGGQGGAAAGASRNWGIHTLFIEFDEKGVVKRIETVPEDKLLPAIRQQTMNGPLLDPAQTVSVKLVHTHLWTTAKPAELLLSRDGIEFHEQGKKKQHDFQTPMQNVKAVTFRGEGRKGLEATPSQFHLTLSFHNRTPAGIHLPFEVDFPTLVTLVRMSQQHGLPLE